MSMDIQILTLRDGVTSISRSRHHAPPRRKFERPARAFEMRTLSVSGCHHCRAAEIGGYRPAQRFPRLNVDRTAPGTPRSRRIAHLLRIPLSRNLTLRPYLLDQCLR